MHPLYFGVNIMATIEKKAMLYISRITIINHLLVISLDWNRESYLNGFQMESKYCFLNRKMH